MNRTPDVELVLRDYFADDGFTAPDHVLDVVEERIARQPQQRAWRVLRRDSHVNSYLKPLLALAAVVVIAVAGIALLGQPSGSGVGGAASPAPSPTPAASASPSAAASASAVFPDWYTTSDGSAAGILPQGSATTQGFLPGSTFTVPAGWVNSTDTADFYALFPDTPANQTEFGRSGNTSEGILLGRVDTPGLGICEGVGDTEGSTAAELVESLVADEALVTSEPADVTIGGWTGARIDAHLNPDWPGTCADTGEPPTEDQKDYRGRFILLDNPGGGRIMIVIDSAHAADFEALVADAMPVVESFQFDQSN